MKQFLKSILWLKAAQAITCPIYVLFYYLSYLYPFSASAAALS